MKMNKAFKETQQKQSQTIASICFGLTVIWSFYTCYDWITPDSLIMFIAYIVLSIIMSFGFFIPVALIGHILKLF